MSRLRFHPETVYSPEEHGYYVEIIDGRTGETVETLPKRGLWRRHSTARHNGWARAQQLHNALQETP